MSNNIRSQLYVKLVKSKAMRTVLQYPRKSANEWKLPSVSAAGTLDERAGPGKASAGSPNPLGISFHAWL